jgi:hypothetical protein
MKQRFNLVLLALAVSLCKPFSVTAQVNVQDSLALVALYNSTDGPHWKNHTNWLTAAPVSQWYGIYDGNFDDGLKITGIYLQNNQLSGSIPPDLGNLNHLAYLILSNNQLNGSISPKLGNLTKVNALDLDNNQLRGSIPPHLGNLANLNYLHLSNNRLSGGIPPNWVVFQTSMDCI